MIILKFIILFFASLGLYAFMVLGVWTLEAFFPGKPAKQPEIVPMDEIFPQLKGKI